MRIRPPLTYRMWPVMNVARSEARNATASATSVEVPSAGRDQADQVFPDAGLGQVVPGQVGLDVAGRDRVHRDAVRRPLPGHHPDQLVQATLGGRVGRVVGVREQPGHRRQEDHPPVAGRAHLPAHRLPGPVRAGQVQADQVGPGVVVEVQDGEPVVPAHRVQEYLNRSQPPCCLLDDATARLRVGQVGGQALEVSAMLANSLLQLGEPGLVHVDGQHPGTQLGQRESARRTQSTRPGHQRGPAAQPKPVIHPRSLHYLTIHGLTTVVLSRCESRFLLVLRP